jgi:hypothetical protein
VAPGEHVGLVGPSGSGKTTLTKLVLRFMDVSGGRILIDGQDIALVTQRTLRRHISYVPQEPQMLHRSIAENICYGIEGLGEPDMDLVHRVGHAAHVWEFVSHLPDGYDTVVGERGLKLSGGQLLGYHHLELGVGAGRGPLAVGSPAPEGGGVAEAVALEIVVGHLADEVGGERLPAQVLLGVPP